MSTGLAHHGARKIRWWRHTVTLLLIALLASAFVPAGASALDPVLSDEEKQDTILAMIEAWVPYAEGYYVRGPPSYYNVGGLGVSRERGEGCIALAYATLLRAKPTARTLGGISRTTMEDHVEEAIRAVINAHSSIRARGWGGTIRLGGEWQGPTIAAAAGWAAQLAWATLEADTKSRIQRIVELEAEAVMAWEPEGYTEGDTSLEEDVNFAYVLAVGAAIFPSARHAEEWEEEAIRMTLNAASLDADETNRTRIDGRNLEEWVQTGENGNLFDDYTAVNHGFFHPVYLQGLALGQGEMASWYADVEKTLPEAFSWRTGTVWDQVLGYLAWDDGDIVAPQITDWTRHDYQHIEALAYQATRERRYDVSVYESRALELLQRRQTANGDGSLYDNGIPGYEADVIKTLAGAWLIHEKFGPSPEPTAEQFNAVVDDYYGVKEFANEELIVSKHADALVTFSWANGEEVEPMGLVVPSAAGHEDDPVLMSYETNSSIGGLVNPRVESWHCRCELENMFSTAGKFSEPVGRKYSMTTFEDGSTLLLDRGAEETFGYDFEDIPGIAERRTIWDQTGEVGFRRYGPLTGSWANVSDRFGLVVKGGSGMYTEPRSNEANPNWHHLTGDQGERTSHNRGALVLPNATHTQTATLAADVLQPTITAIENRDWSALTAIALDGTSRIAVANWYSTRLTGTLNEMSSSLGVPIADRPNDVIVTGSTGSTDFTLEAVSSTGEKGYFYVASSASNRVTARPISERLVKLTNGTTSNTVTVKYDSGPGALQTTSRTLAASEIAYAYAYDGRVAIVTLRATSAGASNPATLAFDGSTGTNWLSAATELRTPECLLIDMNGEVNIGSLTMIPLRGSGPMDYKVQTIGERARAEVVSNCTEEREWTTKETVSRPGDGTTKVSRWTPARARYVRIRITTAYGTNRYRIAVKELTPAPS